MTATTPLHAAVDDQKVLATIAEALQSIQFGAVEITLHNGQVVQIERKEKIRFQPPTRTS
ncbi:hypothetical protein CF98_16840 [Halopseudomonas bauzanensis]|nr:hypothetical protein CF98_16840 [Halopseudomonas bauzanensis]